MESEKLKRMLSNFYEGKSSREEDNELARVLAESSASTGEYKADYEIIRGISAASPKMPESLPARLDAAIAGLELADSRRRARIRNSIIGVAASAAVLLGGFYILDRLTPNPYEIEDPVTAFNETRNALLLVSDGLNSTDAYIDEANSTLSILDLSLYEDEESTEETDEEEQNNYGI